MPATRSHWLTFALVSLVGLIGPASARAGGGPENVFLVVNPGSSESLAIANHYVQWRSIPRRNVLYLRLPTDHYAMEVHNFRARILEPIVEAIAKRGLAGQIDAVVYSSDFPWLVVMTKDFPGWPKTPRGSLTGMTYLARFTLSAELATRQRVTQPASNPYYAAPDPRTGVTPASRAFARPPAGHFLSTMLGVTSGRGNTLGEVLRYLERSARADGTRPAGTVYFMENDNIRSVKRQYLMRPGGGGRVDLFAAAVQQLRDLEVKAEVVSGILPRKKLDVIGLQVGAAKFQWKPVRSQILPGAICEHFTSYGGVMIEGKKKEYSHQTPLSEFLRYGAAGASGTIVEPYAIGEKFPRPGIHVHYARGCTLAEAFYQSVHVPYQLLVVGDPLCRPWARIPEVSVTGLEAGQTVGGKLQLRAQAMVPGDVGVARFELFLDGRREQVAGAGDPFRLDTSALGDGYHELRVVAIANDPVATQGRLVIPFHVDNSGGQVAASLVEQIGARAKGPLRVRARAAGAQSIVLLQNRRVLQLKRGDSADFEVESATLGSGPVTLQVMARRPEGLPVFSAPLAIDIR